MRCPRLLEVWERAAPLPAGILLRWGLLPCLLCLQSYENLIALKHNAPCIHLTSQFPCLSGLFCCCCFSPRLFPVVHLWQVERLVTWLPCWHRLRICFLTAGYEILCWLNVPNLEGIWAARGLSPAAPFGTAHTSLVTALISACSLATWSSALIRSV